MTNWIKGADGMVKSLTYEKTFNPTLYNAQLAREAMEAKSGRKVVKQFSTEQLRMYHPRARTRAMLMEETKMAAL